MGFKLEGLDNIKKKLEEMKSPEYMKNLMTDEICKRIPEASKERHKFKYIDTSSTTFELDETSVSPELFSKIAKAFQ